MYGSLSVLAYMYSSLSVLAYMYSSLSVLAYMYGSVSCQDLHCGDREVVIKVLHVQYYSLGFQEAGTLRSLARADPLNHAHTLRLQVCHTSVPGLS